MKRFPKILLCLILLVSMPAISAMGQETGGDKIVVHVDQDDAKNMNLALNNVQNLLTAYKEKGEKIQIEIVTYGPGLHMLRQDTSPVKDRIATISLANPEVRFTACGNTLAGMTKQEGSQPPLVAEAKVVPAGVVRIVELQKLGYYYIKP